MSYNVMRVETQDVREYAAPSGRIPFREWLRSLRDVRARAIIRVRLNRVRLGNFGDCLSIGGGIQELRVDFGPGYRVYLAMPDNRTVVILCGGEKKTQSKDIDAARSRWADYKARRR